MDKKSKYITIFMCIVTLSALIIFITNYSWFLAIISPTFAIAYHAGIAVPIGLLALLIIVVLFFSKMDKKSKYITVFMCIITLSAPYIFIFPFITRMGGHLICGQEPPWIAGYLLYWCIFFTNPTSVIARCAARYTGFDFYKLFIMDITNSLTVLIITFFFQMLITWMIVLRLSKIEKRFIRRLSYCIVFAVYLIMFLKR